MTTFPSRGPDPVAPVGTMGDIEHRMGIAPIEVLLAERDELVREVAPLRAKHGSFGTYDDLRAIELAKAEAIVRAESLKRRLKVTEAFIKEQAHQAETYADWVIRETEEKARYFELEDKIQSINDTILRANAVARFLTAEVGLSR